MGGVGVGMARWVGNYLAMYHATLGAHIATYTKHDLMMKPQPVMQH